ncbi:MAG: hypothetical protein FWC79_03070 [Oscillospiraceae bacterium]|nr:hypothetical protein [Oscillospiraceae bacterium]
MDNKNNKDNTKIKVMIITKLTLAAKALIPVIILISIWNIVLNMFFDLRNIEVNEVSRAVDRVIEESVEWRDGEIYIPSGVVADKIRDHLGSRGFRGVLLRDSELIEQMIIAEVVTSFPRTQYQTDIQGSVFIRRGDEDATFLRYNDFGARAAAAETYEDFVALKRILYS